MSIYILSDVTYESEGLLHLCMSEGMSLSEDSLYYVQELNRRSGARTHVPDAADRATYRGVVSCPRQIVVAGRIEDEPSSGSKYMNGRSVSSVSRTESQPSVR